MAVRAVCGHYGHAPAVYCDFKRDCIYYSVPFCVELVERNFVTVCPVCRPHTKVCSVTINEFKCCKGFSGQDCFQISTSRSR